MSWGPTRPWSRASNSHWPGASGQMQTRPGNGEGGQEASLVRCQRALGAPGGHPQVSLHSCHSALWVSEAIPCPWGRSRDGNRSRRHSLSPTTVPNEPPHRFATMQKAELDVTLSATLGGREEGPYRWKEARGHWLGGWLTCGCEL